MTLNISSVSEATKLPQALAQTQEQKTQIESKKTKIYKTAKEVLEWLGWGVVIVWGGASLKEMYFPRNSVSNEALIQIFDTDGNGQLSKDEIEKAKSLIRKLGGKNE